MMGDRMKAWGALLALLALGWVIATATFALFSCNIQGVSLAVAPTANTVRLTPAQIDRAWQLEAQCRQTWPTGDDEADLAEADRRLAAHGVTVIERRRMEGPLIALPGLLTLPRGFSERGAASRVRSLAHELFHYCRYAMDPMWVDGLTTSAGRWVEEAPAEAQDLRTSVVQGVDPRLGAHLAAFRDTYMAWDLESGQFTEETTRLWRSVL